MQRYSRKRQAIIDCLNSTKEHPSAEWVYEQIKSRFPDLSLATVYRNLAQLKCAGLVQSVGTVQGQERFDANVLPHTHVICMHCGRIVDVMDVSIPDEFVLKVQEATSFQIFKRGVQLYGICTECQKSQVDE